MHKLLRLWLDRLYLACGGLAALFMIAILVVIVIQMGSRWMGLSLPGLATYAGYFMAATSFFALGYAFSKGAHIRVTIILGGLGTYRRFGEMWCTAVSAIISAFLSYYAIKTTYMSYVLGEISQAQDATPVWIPQIPMAIGSVVLTIALIDLFSQVLFSDVDQSFQLDSEVVE